MSEIEIISDFPDDDEFWIYESKGWLPVEFVCNGRRHKVVFYDRERLNQTIRDELEEGIYFFEKGVVVVEKISKELIEKSLRDIAKEI